MAHAPHSLQGYDAALGGRAWTALEYSSNAATQQSRETRIADAILDLAREEAACLGGARLLRIGVNIGVDCEVDFASLEDVFKVIRQGTDLEHVLLSLIPCMRRAICRRCRREVPISASIHMCPECTSQDLEVIGGDELELAFIEVERA